MADALTLFFFEEYTYRPWECQPYMRSPFTRGMGITPTPYGGVPLEPLLFTRAPPRGVTNALRAGAMYGSEEL